MKENKFLVAFTVITLVSTVGITSLYAANNDSNESVGQTQQQGKSLGEYPSFDPEKQQAIQEAILNNDYEAWKELIGDAPITEKINEENFARFSEAHQLIDQAKNIFEELGIEKQGPGPKGEKGMHVGKESFGKMDPEKLKAAKEALDNHDYNAWLQAVGQDSKIAQEIAQENFDKYVEAHKLIKQGDLEEARIIMNELGLNFRKGNPHQ